jgi:hypothetical protein
MKTVPLFILAAIIASFPSMAAVSFPGQGTCTCTWDKPFGVGWHKGSVWYYGGTHNAPPYFWHETLKPLP